MPQITYSFSDLNLTKDTTAEEVVAAKIEQFNEVRQELGKVAYNPDLKASIKREAKEVLLQIEYFVTGMQRVLEFQRWQLRQQTLNERVDREIEEQLIVAKALAVNVLGYKARAEFSENYKSEILNEAVVINRKFASLQYTIAESLKKTATDWSDRMSELKELHQQMKVKLQELAQA